VAYFWSFILALVVLTGVLASGDLFEHTEPSPDGVVLIELPEWAGVVAPDPDDVSEALEKDDAVAADREPVPSEALTNAADASVSEQRAGPVEGSVEIASGSDEPVTEPEPSDEPEQEVAEDNAPGGDLGIPEDVLARLAAAQQEQAAPEEPEDEDPGYTINGDGSIVVRTDTGELRIPGRGTDDSAYVLSWDVLRSVQRAYDPKKDKDDLPAWLDAIDGKHVVVEGNTLVALVASETDELLVMQNPWDGCCIGVPPTPYDAIEVKLNRSVTFGYSATGYGAIKGTMKIDPYVVSGWLMGLYVIENASYTSGAGEELSEF
jgi:hypothetical protein